MNKFLNLILEHEAREYKPKKSRKWVQQGSILLANIIEQIDITKYRYVKIFNGSEGSSSETLSITLLLPNTVCKENNIFFIHMCDCGKLGHLFHYSK